MPTLRLLQWLLLAYHHRLRLQRQQLVLLALLPSSTLHKLPVICLGALSAAVCCCCVSTPLTCSSCCCCICRGRRDPAWLLHSHEGRTACCCCQLLQPADQVIQLACRCSAHGVVRCENRSHMHTTTRHHSVLKWEIAVQRAYTKHTTSTFDAKAVAAYARLLRHSLHTQPHMQHMYIQHTHTPVLAQ